MTRCTHCYHADAVARVVYGVNYPDGTPCHAQERVESLCPDCLGKLRTRSRGAVQHGIMYLQGSPLNANAPAAVSPGMNEKAASQ